MRDYRCSQNQLDRAERIIPMGAQTVSKSRRFYPYGASPYFLARGAGCHVWDIDGNEYVDFVSGLASLNLGYNDPDVTQAVAAQLQDGVVFSLSHPLEVVVAEKIVSMVPCAQMVRFGKNGSDVTSAAIRLARAYTKRDHVAVCGYHGWQDWYIGSTAFARGVPALTQALTHTFQYNDIDSLRALFTEFPDQIAAVIMEPMNGIEPMRDYLHSVRDVSHEAGALLVFDELITGFRVAKGGAQQCYDVTPDLATFGKAMANGYPISALTGARKFMCLLDEVFFSLTAGGETLSLAAANATLDKLNTHPVIETMFHTGTRLKCGVETVIGDVGMGNSISISGHPTRTFLQFKESGGYSEWQIKTLFMQEVIARGILTVGAHNITYAHEDSDVDTLLGVYEEVFSILKRSIDSRTLMEQLRCDVLPAFKLR